jgi:hypothetical protein
MFNEAKFQAEQDAEERRNITRKTLHEKPGDKKAEPEIKTDPYDERLDRARARKIGPAAKK